MTDLSTLLKAATPDPPVDVSLDDVARLVRARRRRVLAPIAAAVLVLAVVASALVVTRRHSTSVAGDQTTAPITQAPLVTSDISGLHFRHPRGWVAETFGPTGVVLLSNVIPARCKFIDDPGCNPTNPARPLGSGQVFISVTAGVLARHSVNNPNQVVAGLPARVVVAGSSGCPVSARTGVVATLPGYIIRVCGGEGVDVRGILDGVYLDRPARKDLGIVTGTFQVVGGPAPGTARPIKGTVRLTDQASGKTTATAAASDGSFAVAVPPGMYVVTAKSPFMGGRETCLDTQRSRMVFTGRVTTATVYCSMR